MIIHNIKKTRENTLKKNPSRQPPISKYDTHIIHTITLLGYIKPRPDNSNANVTTSLQGAKGRISLLTARRTMQTTIAIMIIKHAALRPAFR